MDSINTNRLTYLLILCTSRIPVNQVINILNVAFNIFIIFHFE